MGPKWRRGEVPGRRGRRESLVARGSSRGDEVGLCRIGSLVEMGKTSGRRFVCRRRAWTGTGSRGRQLDSGHGHGWRVGDEQRGARKENNPRSDSRGAMCVWCRHQGPDNRQGGMGFGASGPAECCRAGKRRGLDRKSDDNPVAKPILLSTVQSFSVPLPAWQAARAGRWQRQLAGPGLVRDSASRRGWTEGSQWPCASVDAALRSVGGDGTKRKTGSTGCGRPKVPTSGSQEGRSPNGHGSLWQWAMGNGMEMVMANFTGRRDSSERTRASSPARWTPMTHQGTMAACCCMEEGIWVSAGLSKEGCLPHRWWLLGIVKGSN